MRPLIEKGHVYSAMPPLYKVSKGKNDYYCYTDRELNETLARLDRNVSEVQRNKR